MALHERQQRFARGAVARSLSFNVILPLPPKGPMAEDSDPLHPESADVLESFVLHALLEHPTACDAAVLGGLWQAARDGEDSSTSDQRTASEETLASVQEAARSLQRTGLAVRVGPGEAAWTASPAAKRAGALLTRV